MIAQHGRIRAFRGLKGVSDILGVLPDGRFLAVECKGPKGKPSPEQVEFIENVRKMGGVAFVARSLQDVKNGLSGVLGAS